MNGQKLLAVAVKNIGELDELHQLSTVELLRIVISKLSPFVAGKHQFPPSEYRSASTPVTVAPICHTLCNSPTWHSYGEAVSIDPTQLDSWHFFRHWKTTTTMCWTGLVLRSVAIMPRPIANNCIYIHK